MQCSCNFTLHLVVICRLFLGHHGKWKHVRKVYMWPQCTYESMVWLWEEFWCYNVLMSLCCDYENSFDALSWVSWGHRLHFWEKICAFTFYGYYTLLLPAMQFDGDIRSRMFQIHLWGQGLLIRSRYKSHGVEIHWFQTGFVQVCCNKFGVNAVAEMCKMFKVARIWGEGGGVIGSLCLRANVLPDPD